MKQYNQIPSAMGNNPSREERHRMLNNLLKDLNRTEDYENILTLLSPPPDLLTKYPKNIGRDIKIGIIGAGEAGLAAAFELRKIGCSITILEAKERIGGRVLTHYFDRDKKYFAELGPMRVPISHETTWHFIDLFKLPTHPFSTRNVRNYFFLRNTRAVNDNEGKSVMDNIYPKFNLPPQEQNVPWRSLSDRMYDIYFNQLSAALKKELIEIKQKYSDEISIIDNITLREAYENALLSQNAIAMIGYLSAFEKSFFDLSLMEIMQETYTVDFNNTYYIETGMSSLPLAIYDSLTTRNRDVDACLGERELGTVNAYLSTAVNGIYYTGDNNKVVLECKDLKSGSTEYPSFDYIICAIPFTSLKRIKINPLFPVQKMQGIKELNYEPAQKTHFYMRERFWEQKPYCMCGGSSVTDLPNTTVFYPSDHAIPFKDMPNTWVCDPNTSPNEPGVLQASYNWSENALVIGNEHLPLRIEDIKTYVSEIHNLNRDYLEKNIMAITSIYWPRVQYIWGGGNLAKPGEKTRFSFINSLPEFNHRLFFAGEHISQKHLWQQGALQTGMKAASAIAEAIKLRS